MTTVEIVAREYWNRLSHATRTRLEAQTTTTPSHKYVSSPVLWDDEDMSEGDKKLTIEATRAAILAMADAIDDTMIEAFMDDLEAQGVVGWPGSSKARRALQAALRASLAPNKE